METVVEYWDEQEDESSKTTIWNRIFAVLCVFWNRIFAVLCVFAVLLDPLFFYTPIVLDDIKCLGFDTRMKKVALVSRSITDFFYILDIVIQICTTLNPGKFKASFIPQIDEQTLLVKGKKSVAEALALAKRTSLLYILIDIVAVLPLPQVVIFIFFIKLRSSKSMVTRIALNCVILLQYVPRVLRIYIPGKVVSLDARSGIWIKSVFDFFPFILASHVFGAMWYFFAVQRLATCWEYACQSKNGCQPSNFDCRSNAFRNVTLLNNLCPTNLQDTALFDFGIFLDALRSGLVESTDFPQKLFQCFWWGLRNLSSFASNLQPSPYALENFFSVFISISGMLLFLIYLNANLQTYAELEAKRSKQIELKKKMQMINPEIDLWLHKNGLRNHVNEEKNTNLKMMIMKNVQLNLAENKHVDVENILYILPIKNRMHIMRPLRLNSLKKIKMLEGMDESALEVISRHLKPVVYAQDTYIIREGEPFDKIVFITQGTAWTYITSNGSYGSSDTKCLRKGEVYGEQLLNWALKFASLAELPMSPRIVKSQTKVEAFIIRANDVKFVVSILWKHFKEKIPSSDLEKVCRLRAVSSLQAAWRRYQSRVSMEKHRINETHLDDITCQSY